MRIPFALVLTILYAAALPGKAFAQRSEHSLSLSGAVYDASTTAPLAGATLVLQPEVLGAFPAGPAAGSAFATSSRVLVSNTYGSYRFTDLPAGVYRLYVTRISYRPYSVVVELREPPVLPVSVALVPEPLAMPALELTWVSRGPFTEGNELDATVDAARLFALERRRHQFLATDVRELTHVDVSEAVTLGEPDVLRALQRLPGVSSRSDYKAELWSRGAGWAHTRVFFDGVPLFNPLHALGMVSGIGSNAVGAVWYHPGSRSASIGEGAAAVVDLESRRATGAGEVNVNGDLSLMSAGLAMDQRVLNGRAGWMLSGRRTYLDWLTSLARQATGRERASFPYGFAEVAGRLDAWVAPRTALEASWLWEGDHLTSADPGAELARRAEWGNTAARVSLTAPIGDWYLRHTVSTSEHDAAVRSERAELIGYPAPVVMAPGWDSESRIRQVAVTGTLWNQPISTAGAGWSFGYSLERQNARYYGPPALPVPGRLDSYTYADSPPLRWDVNRTIGVLWGERAWKPHATVGVRAGLRAEAGEKTVNTGSLHLSPRLSIRYEPVPEVAISGGYSRVHQYAQAIAPGGVHIASLSTAEVWVLADDRTVPTLRSDIFTAGMETWLGPGRIVSLNSFYRDATGLATADPRPGALLDREIFVAGDNRAYGVEASVRQITGQLTGSVSYTLSKSETDAAGLEFPALADRRHVLDATALFRVHPSMRAGAAFTAATGVPFTRTIATAEECRQIAGCDQTRLPWLAAPNDERAPYFASLDLLFDWSARIRDVELGAYVQLRNALNRRNATVYTGEAGICPLSQCEGIPQSAYERGVPRLPVIGIRVRY